MAIGTLFPTSLQIGETVSPSSRIRDGRFLQISYGNGRASCMGGSGIESQDFYVL